MGKPSGRAEEQVDDDTLMPEPQARQRAPDFIPDAAPDFIPDGGGSPGATPYRPPGFEALKAQVATYPKEEPREGLLAGMSRRLIGTADPIHDVPAVLSDAIHHPLEGLENAPGRITAALGAPQQLAALRRVPSALKSGQYGEALGSALEGVIPIGGPMAAAIGEGLGSEHPEEGVRDAAALGYGALLGKAWPRVIDLAKDAAGAYSVPKPNALALGERFTPEQIRATAKEQAIPMTRAEISGSPIATAVQKQVERGLLSSHLADQHATAVKGSLGEWSNRLSDNLAPAATSEEAGGRIQTSLEGALAREKATAEANFKAVDGAAQGVTGSLAPAKQAVQQALDESSFIRNAVPALDAKRSTTVLQGMLATKEAPSPIAGQPPIRVPMLPDNASFSQMQQLRSALLDEARHPDNVLNEQGQGRIRLAIGAVDQAMAEAAKNLNPQALDLWRGANQHWADVHENFNNPRSPIYQILKSPDPNSAFQQLVPKSGGSPQVARQAMRYLGDDAGTLKREFVQRLIDPKGNGQPNFGGVEQRLNAYKEGYLNELFQPEELDELRKFARLSRSAGSLARMENPSNTAVGVGQVSDAALLGAAATGHPPAALIPVGKYVAGKVIYPKPRAFAGIDDMPPPGGPAPATGPGGPPTAAGPAGPPPTLPGIRPPVASAGPAGSIIPPPAGLARPNSSAVGPIEAPVGLARAPEAQTRLNLRSTLKAPLPQGEAMAGGSAAGSKAVLKTVSGDMPVRYRVVEASSLKTSHDPNSFAKNPNYPEGVQERAYDTSKEEQLLVIQHAQKYDPSFTINSNPDAVNGPPVVTADGTVLGGNGRTMSTARLYAAGQGDIYRTKLNQEAANYGIDPKSIAGMKEPVLVRELTQPMKSTEQARLVGSALNKPFTAALSPNERAVSAGRSISGDTLQQLTSLSDKVGDDATIRDVMGQRPRDVLRVLQGAGVITDVDRGHFMDPDGQFTEDGKRFVERAMVGSVVDDVGLLDKTPSAVLNKVSGSVADLSKLMNRGDAWDITPLVREAMRETSDTSSEMATRGLTSKAELARQPNMLRPSASGPVNAMVNMLDAKAKTVKQALRAFSLAASGDVQSQGGFSFYQRPEAWSTFNEVFGTKFSKLEYEKALSKARGSSEPMQAPAALRRIPTGIQAVSP